MNDDRKLYSNIFKLTFMLAAIVGIVSYIFTKDINIFYGFLFGAIARLAGFATIISMGKRIFNSSNPAGIAMSHYGVRYIFYGVVFYISILKGANIIALLLGFISVNFVIYTSQAIKSKGSD